MKAFKKARGGEKPQSIQRIVVAVLMVALMAVLFSGCQAVVSDAQSGNAEQTTAAPQGSDASKETAKITAYASIYPLYYFAQRIGGERVEVMLAVPPGTDAHDFDPTARQVGDMTSADVFIYNGLGLEHWIENLLAQMPQELEVVQTSEGIETHSMEEALAGGEHDHEHEGEDDGHNHEGGIDPHVWLDPIKAQQQADRIYEAFKAADPEGASVYQANYETLKTELTALDTAYRDGLAGYTRREIVVGHASFGYLAERYGLVQLPISGVSPLEEPSAADLGKLSKLVKTHGVTTIFYETLANPKFSEVLAAETGTKTAVLNPLEGLTQSELDAGENYLTIMKKNLEAIQAALAD